MAKRVQLEQGGRGRQSDAARRRVAVEIVDRHEASLKRTARRYSLNAEDAEDAYQRALEIVLTKAPTADLRELIRWTQTVTKHEALALRANRERLLSRPAPHGDGGPAPDPVTQLVAPGDGPEEQAERREAIARSREALRALKPAELRALTLLAQGYSYAEIGQITGFSQTKINRVLAEGRQRFRSLLSSSEDGSRCHELQPLLSAFCDGETSREEAVVVREHLRACASCRSTMRAYRAAPRIAVALAPALPPSRSLLERAHDLLAGLASRMPGLGDAGEPTTTQIAATGGTRGAGMAALAKLVTLCGATAGGAAACVATGILPAPAALIHEHSDRPAVVRSAERAVTPAPGGAPQFTPPQPAPEPSVTEPETERQPEPPAPDATAETGAVEYEPPPAPAASSAGESTESSPSSGSPAGEFGP